MDNQKLRELAQEIQDVILKYDVNFEMFAVNITVTQEYWELAEQNLEHTGSIPMVGVFSEADRNWLIQLIRPKIGMNKHPIKKI